jgi:hypothetical protein
MCLSPEETLLNHVVCAIESCCDVYRLYICSDCMIDLSIWRPLPCTALQNGSGKPGLNGLTSNCEREFHLIVPRHGGFLLLLDELFVCVCCLMSLPTAPPNPGRCVVWVVPPQYGTAAVLAWIGSSLNTTTCRAPRIGRRSIARKLHLNLGWNLVHVSSLHLHQVNALTSKQPNSYSPDTYCPACCLPLYVILKRFKDGFELGSSSAFGELIPCCHPQRQQPLSLTTQGPWVGRSKFRFSFHYILFHISFQISRAGRPHCKE